VLVQDTTREELQQQRYLDQQKQLFQSVEHIAMQLLSTAEKFIE